MTAPIETIPFRQRKLEQPPELAAKSFYEIMTLRRSVREFSRQAVTRETIDWIIAAAGTAPSGANKQPWRFVAVDDPGIKREIRLAAEIEEREFYASRAGEKWLADLAVLGTDDKKPFLEIAPWLIVVFKCMRTDAPDPRTDSDQVYYVNESVGIAVGLLLAAAHHAGLCTLTHTPSPMKFLGRILNRPDYERPYLLIPVGYAADGCQVPDIHRRPLDEIRVFNRG